MDGRRVGRSLRALRIRSDRRQKDVAAAAGVSRQMVARVEAGDLDRVQVETIDRITRAVGGTLDIGVRWRGEGLDRLLDSAHAALVERVVAMLASEGWETAVEVSFSIWGERGSVDVVGLRREVAAILIVEVKSVIPDAGGMLATLHRKARLGPEIARQLGWPCRSVSRLLVVGDWTTTRRRIRMLAAMFAAALPARGWAVRRWLRDPRSVLAGILFLPFATRGGTSQGLTGRQRVRLPKRRPDGA